ncbi:MAG: SUMF1/EgtB/PvdO family nonheme iron enzyme [Candidatus Thiodiazotropha endolucinida]|nr:SUMF1/EgtB/PvdO family nonheme iron enzyme [Candidatus Thiodiazotropha taylori]MCW4311976.1 SUMF1/EgtB/PvdO family nonheme iron enzyme [Candidatus Thiodiazotropha taylori]
MNCINCNETILDGAKFCLHCGAPQQVTCANCGAELPAGAKFCMGCGSPVDTGSSASGGAASALIGYCYRSGKAIHAGDPHFKCTDCDQLFLETYRFEETPVCQQCAQEQGMAQTLEQERSARAEAEAAREAEEAQRSIQQQLGITDADWVSIQGGRFMMGSPETEEGHEDRERQHWVKVGDLEMMKTPVTWAMYLAYCEATSRELPEEPEWGRPKDHPVVNVGYWDAVDYAQWLSEQTGWRCRLPTEAEWEYACRAGTTTPFWMGETISTDQATYHGGVSYGSGDKGIVNFHTTQVNLHQANPWGLHDLHGNVYEWCASEYDENYDGKECEDASQDRLNDRDRVVRGGSWMNLAPHVRSAVREKKNSRGWMKRHIDGFRLVRTNR